MGTILVRHLVARNDSFYFQATPAMREAGIFSEALGRDRSAAIARADYLNPQWDAIRIGQPANALTSDSIAWLIREFEQSDWYERLAPRTKLQADQFLKIIKDSPLGRYHVAQVRRGNVRSFHNKLMERKNRTYANKAVKWFRRLMSYAQELELRTDNPAGQMQLRHEPPRRNTWDPEEVETFKAKAIEIGRRNWALAVQLGYDSAQRLGDILALTWHDFDGEGFTFRQQKTGVEIYVALSTESLRMLSETPKRAITIIVGDTQGKPIKQTAFFGKIYREIRAAAGIRQELTFHDLRRTAATEASTVGANVEHITGHRPGSPALKHYVVPNKNASRRAQEIRWGKKDS